MRFIFAAAAAAIATACSQAPAPSPERLAITAPAEETRILAAMSYARWCGSCKALDPKVEAAKATGTFEGVEFALLDYTDRDADTYFANADTLGVGDTMRSLFADSVSTGRLYLISLETGDIVATIDKSMDIETIAQTISDAAA